MNLFADIAAKHFKLEHPQRLTLLEHSTTDQLRLLLEWGLPEEQVFTLRADHLNLPYWRPNSEYDSRLQSQLPSSMAQRYQALIIGHGVQDSVRVGLVEPDDINAITAIERQLKKTVEPELISASTWQHLAGERGQIGALAQAAAAELDNAHRSYRLNEVADVGNAEGAALGRLLCSLFDDGVRLNASDIHIEPEQGGLRIRTRVDGQLQEQWLDESNLAAALLSKLKLLAGLDIAERRLPQDGRFLLQLEGKQVDVRLSTLPACDGESACMRLLDATGKRLDLGQLGLQPNQEQQLRKLLEYRDGLILLAGATGSGKTTTAYAALQSLNRAERKIITVEDPVEYHLPRLTQIQVRSRIGLDFPTVLRASLRHDPDVLLVGELRDGETASTALRAGLTGHLVLSTIHANDSHSALTRLYDLGAEAYVVKAGLRAVVCQQLIRQLCVDCRYLAKHDSQQQSWLAGRVGEPTIDRSWHAHGCSDCQQTGYRGRRAIFDIQHLTDGGIAETLTAQGGGRDNLIQAALVLLREGHTSLAEVRRHFAMHDPLFSNNAFSNNALPSATNLQQPNQQTFSDGGVAA